MTASENFFTILSELVGAIYKVFNGSATPKALGGKY